VYVRAQSRSLSYWNNVASEWTVEEDIEVASRPGEIEAEETDAKQQTSEPISDPYLIQSGDTLNNIAQCTGKTIADLQRLNGLNNYSQLHPGQSLYLSNASAFGANILFLDALRHPIENIPYKLITDGKTVQGKTDTTGTIPQQTTRNERSRVEVLVQDAKGRWHSLVNAASGFGTKLITLVSGALVFPGRTELHPKDAPQSISPPQKSHAPNSQKQSPMPAPAQGTPTKNNPAVKTTKAKGPQEQPILKIEVDIPQGFSIDVVVEAPIFL
jgi:LysM repeat protein